MPSEIPFRISRSSTLTRRSLISRSAICSCSLSFFRLLALDHVWAGGVGVPHPGGPLDVRVQQAPVHRLFAMAGMAGLGGDVGDRAIAVPDRVGPVPIVHELGHVTAGDG